MNPAASAFVICVDVIAEAFAKPKKVFFYKAQYPVRCTAQSPVGAYTSPLADEDYSLADDYL